MQPLLPCPALHRPQPARGEAAVIARRIASRRNWARRRRRLLLRARLFGRRKTPVCRPPTPGAAFAHEVFETH